MTPDQPGASQAGRPEVEYGREPARIPSPRPPVERRARPPARGRHADARANRFSRRWLALVAAVGLVAVALVVGAQELGTLNTRPNDPGRGTATGSLDPTRYTADGCVVLDPVAGSRGQTVFLDPGHGGLDPGALGAQASLQEKDLTLAVTLATADELRRAGFRVALSRSGDSLGSPPSATDAAAGTLSVPGQRAQLSARARCANLAGAAALVSVHLNSFDQPEVRGAETLYEPERPFGADNRRLAELLQTSIVRAFADIGRPIPDRGILGGSTADAEADAHDLVVLGPARPGRIDEPSTMPGALIEPLFLTNPIDADLATSADGQHALARAVTAALAEFLGR